MKLTDQQKEGKDILHEIIVKAWDDKTFKQSLIDNPELTLESHFKTKLPEGKKIKVTDQSDPGYLYINIPVRFNEKSED